MIILETAHEVKSTGSPKTEMTSAHCLTADALSLSTNLNVRSGEKRYLLLPR